jgi:CubicO group peptidase (beta-lactamase class C family)
VEGEAGTVKKNFASKASKGPRIVTVSVLFVLSLWTAPSARADALDDYLNSQLRRQRIAGLSVAVIENGRIVKARGYGLANLETGTPATANTVYKIASVSKSIMGVATMLLAEDGKLNLDDTIDRYFPDAPEAWKSITVRNLVTHTSGIVEDPPGFTPFKQQSDLAVVKSLYSVPLLFKPGERWSYSNAAYFAIADIIRQASGMSWPDFATARLFRPLGMVATRVTTTTEVVPHRAEGYIWNEGRFTRTEDWVAVRPSGAFLSTVLDLSKWEAALRQRRLLKPSSWDQVLAPVRLTNGKTHPYGLGFFLDPWQGHRRIHHDGGLPGFETIFEHFPDNGLSVLMILNTDEIDHHRLAHAIAGFYRPALAPPAYKTVEDIDPSVTAKVRRFVDGFVKGDPDASLFPQGANVSPDMKAKLGARLRKWGTVQSLALVEYKPEGNGVVSYRYRISYPGAAAVLLQVFERMGLIVGWGFETDTQSS